MKSKVNYSPLNAILCVFSYNFLSEQDVHRIDDLNVNVNISNELVKVFDSEIHKRFLGLSLNEQKIIITTLEDCLSDITEDFSEIFENYCDYFEDENKVVNKRQFMEVLLNCLKRYQQESN